MNLLNETREILTSNGKNESDVVWVGVGDRYHKRPAMAFSWQEFAALSGFEYDDGFGGNEIAGSLKVVGDNWWLERGEYDGSEWWEFKTLPTMPEPGSPCRDDLLQS
jgi:hypothetical protein